MTARELRAAGITEPALCAAYSRCRRLNSLNGKTYFLATRLLTPPRRPAVHALYGFARSADDIVDGPAPPPAPGIRHAPHPPPGRDLRDAHDLGAVPGFRDARAVRDIREAARRAAGLGRLETSLRRALREGRSDDPVLAALADTVTRYGIDPAHFTAFMRSMRMDLHVTDYPTYQDLLGYMHGSAAVIGLEVLPVLGTAGPAEEAEPHAASLGIAFQLTNFLRDVGEDLDRDRVYLPADLLAAHGADRALLTWCRRTGRADPRVRAALRELTAVTRGLYAHAAVGIPMLDPLSRPCVRTAHVLYRGILDEIEAADWAVLRHRAVVPRRRRAAVAGRGLLVLAAARAHRALPLPDSGRERARLPSRGRRSASRKVARERTEDAAEDVVEDVVEGRTEGVTEDPSAGAAAPRKVIT